MNHDVPIFKVLRILDKRTLVIGGDLLDVELLSVGKSLSVLSKAGPMIPELNLPLVIPKAVVIVTANMGAYVIAQPEEQTFDTSILTSMFIQKTRSRPNLNVNESLLTGNPAAVPIDIGDVVVKTDDVAAYVGKLARDALSAKGLPAGS